MATERYLLGEMNGPELDAFEEHMFVCLECAAAVKSGATFTDNARAVFQEQPDFFKAAALANGAAKEKRSFAGWFSGSWFSFPQLATSFAAMALLCVAGYQQFVVIPALRNPQATTVYPVAAIARGGEAATVIPAGGDLITLEMDSLSKSCAGGCTGRIRNSKGFLGRAIDLKISPDRTALIVLSRAVLTPGEYSVVVQSEGPDGKEVGQYPFRVE